MPACAGFGPAAGPPEAQSCAVSAIRSPKVRPTLNFVLFTGKRTFRFHHSQLTHTAAFTCKHEWRRTPRSHHHTTPGRITSLVLGSPYVRDSIVGSIARQQLRRSVPSAQSPHQTERCWRARLAWTPRYRELVGRVVYQRKSEIILTISCSDRWMLPMRAAKSVVSSWRRQEVARRRKLAYDSAPAGPDPLSSPY